MKWMLPVLFTVYYSIITVFTHIHIEDGTLILHAHPFKKTTDGTCHTHASFAEIILFHNLSTIQVEDGAVCSILLENFLPHLSRVVQNPTVESVQKQIIGEPSLRAPPFA